MSETRAHSSLGASKFKRIMSCPGSVALCATLPEPPTSEHAAEGTRLHALQEHCLKNGEWDASPYIGLRLEDEKPDVPELTKEQCDAVTVVLGHVWEILRQHADAELFVEVKFGLADVHPDMFGTCDVCVMRPDGVLHVIDAKYGRGVVVEVENNPQLLYYALGAVRAMGNRCPSRVVLTIAQPRIDHEAGPVRSWEVDAFELLNFEGDARDAVAAALKPDAPLVAGDHCKFCPGARLGGNGEYPCAAFGKQKTEALDAAFSVINGETSLNIGADEIGRRLAQTNVLEKYIRDFREFARMTARTEVPTGYEWTPGQRKWRWNGDDSTIAMLLPPECVKPCTPLQAQKALGKDGFAAVEPLVIKGEGAPVLMQKGKRKKSLTLAEVNAWFADSNNREDAFSVIDDTE